MQLEQTPRKCIECGKIKIIRGWNKCGACYERDRRKMYPELYKKIEQKRGNTRKRKEWQGRYNREYYAKNAEALKKYQSEWRKNNPEQRDEFKRKYRNRKNNLPDTLTLDEWEDILKQYHGICIYCGSDADIVKEHWIPVSKGGGYTKDNIVPACAICNSRKGTMTGEEYIDMLDIQEWQKILEVIDDYQSLDATTA